MPAQPKEESDEDSDSDTRAARVTPAPGETFVCGSTIFHDELEESKGAQTSPTRIKHSLSVSGRERASSRAVERERAGSRERVLVMPAGSTLCSVLESLSL